MPQMQFTPENKTADPGSFPKLRLEKDARARIVCLENPEYGWMHRLAGPKIVNDKPFYSEDEKTHEQRMQMDFLGRPLCLGDKETMASKKSDPKHCIACEKAEQSDRIGPAQRRFAMHVVSYAIKPGGFILQDPYQVSIVVWAFADRTFNKLVDFQQEWGPLAKHDLMLGPCENFGFQKFEIAIAAKAYWWDGGDQTRTMTAQAFQNNRCEDLMVFVGRKVPKSFMEEDIARVEARWKIADKHASGAPAVDEADHDAALTTGLNDLLHSEAQPEEGAAKTDLDVAALLAGAGVATEPAREVTNLVKPPTTQDVADIRAMIPDVAAASEAAKAGPKVVDVLNGGSAPAQPEVTVPDPPATPQGVVGVEDMAPVATANESGDPIGPNGELDFTKFLEQFEGEDA